MGKFWEICLKKAEFPMNFFPKLLFFISKLLIFYISDEWIKMCRKNWENCLKKSLFLS